MKTKNWRFNKGQTFFFYAFSFIQAKTRSVKYMFEFILFHFLGLYVKIFNFMENHISLYFLPRVLDIAMFQAVDLSFNSIS
jgi:hypothetical protein